MPGNSRNTRGAGVLLAALLAAACTAPGPTENPPGADREDAPVVSLCYAPMIADPADILAAAAEACRGAGVSDAAPSLWRRDALFNDCPLLSKARASFRCMPRRGVATEAGRQGKSRSN